VTRLAIAVLVVASSAAAAEVTGLAPATGPPGTVVVVTGNGFVPGTIVLVDDRIAAVRGLVPTAIRFVVPIEATDGRVVVRVPGSAADIPAGTFAIERPFAATGVSPAEGPPGARVDIAGTGFLPGDRVRLGDRPAVVIERSPVRLVVEVPAGALSAPFVIERAGAQARTARFVVRVPASAAPAAPPAPAPPPPAPAPPPPAPPSPSITSFSPSAGPAGTRVRLAGTGFDADARVLYGDRPVAILARAGTTELTVLVPADARAGAPFVVRSRGREVRSGAYFDLAVPPALVAVSPTAGPPGTRIAIEGRNLGGREELYLGDAPLPVLDRRGDRLVAEIPAGAASGPLVLDVGGERRPTPFTFEVLPPLVVASFAPDSGPPGTEVRIVGRFGAATTVRYGTLPCAVKSRAPGRLVVVIPDAARAHDYLWVEDLAQRVRAADPFRVTR
jgi:hypothetical protein